MIKKQLVSIASMVVNASIHLKKKDYIYKEKRKLQSFTW